jgi:hypothetical protein
VLESPPAKRIPWIMSNEHRNNVNSALARDFSTQIGYNRKPVGLGGRRLESTCIIPIGRVVQHLI